MEEIWKEIEGTNGNYKISNLGRVLSVRKNLIMTHCFGTTKYPVVTIRFNKKAVLKYIHRLVAEAFIPNPEGKPFINHLNADRTDFSISNLEWCTHSENVKHEYTQGRRTGKTNMKGRFAENNPTHKKIRMISASGLSKIVCGVSEAARLVNGSASHISKVCLGKLKTHKGYKWEYA